MCFLQGPTYAQQFGLENFLQYLGKLSTRPKKTDFAMRSHLHHIHVGLRKIEPMCGIGGISLLRQAGLLLSKQFQKNGLLRIRRKMA